MTTNRVDPILKSAGSLEEILQDVRRIIAANGPDFINIRISHGPSQGGLTVQVNYTRGRLRRQASFLQEQK